MDQAQPSDPLSTCLEHFGLAHGHSVLIQTGLWHTTRPKHVVCNTSPPPPPPATANSVSWHLSQATHLTVKTEKKSQANIYYRYLAVDPEKSSWIIYKNMFLVWFTVRLCFTFSPESIECICLFCEFLKTTQML